MAETQQAVITQVTHPVVVCDLMTFRFILMCTFGVSATAALVVSNKHLMERYLFAGAAGLLTLSHAISTCLTLRLGFCFSSPPTQTTTWPWLLGINLLGSFSIFCSNMLLKVSSVAFHQVSRLMALPIGAFIDFVVRRKLRTATQYLSMALISYGVMLGSNDATATIESVLIAVLFNFSWLLAAPISRHICERDGLSAADFLYLSVPWSIACSFLWLIASGFHFSSFVQWYTTSAVNWFAFLIDFVLNLALAFSVNYLSTWAQKNCSSLLYAVLSQVKTACTVALGAAFFNTAMSRSQICGLTVCLFVAAALALDEAHEKTRYDSDNDEKELRYKRTIYALLISATVILVVNNLLVVNNHLHYITLEAFHNRF